MVVFMSFSDAFNAIITSIRVCLISTISRLCMPDLINKSTLLLWFAERNWILEKSSSNLYLSHSYQQSPRQDIIIWCNSFQQEHSDTLTSLGVWGEGVLPLNIFSQLSVTTVEVRWQEYLIRKKTVSMNWTNAPPQSSTTTRDSFNITI